MKPLKKRNSILFFSCIYIFCSYAIASKASENQVTSDLAKIQKIASQRKNFSASFEQITFSALRNRNVKQQGLLKFSAPKSFRWEITSPNKELYVSNGTIFWKYNELAKHAQKLDADTGELKFLDVIFKPSTWDKNYTIEAWIAHKNDKGEENADWENPPKVTPNTMPILLIPKQKSRQKKIAVLIDVSKNFVQEIRIFFDNGNKSTVTFTNFVDKPNAESDFTFEPPTGIAIDKEAAKKP